MIWRLILDGFNSVLICIQGSKHILADVLSALDIVDTYNLIDPNMPSIAEYSSLEKEDVLLPANHKTIM